MRKMYEESLINASGGKLVPTEGVYIGSSHPGVVGRYFSVAVGKDLYSQSEDGSCPGMLQGCVEHEVCGGDMRKRAPGSCNRGYSLAWMMCIQTS